MSSSRAAEVTNGDPAGCAVQSCLVALFYGSLAIVFTPDPTLGTPQHLSRPSIHHPL